ncbi:MAG: carboxypeptidase regulatory-like domain-containing protein [Gemmatimonadaceae bacterium]|nr:carboxypeptidase regulatory-like domain-containing protein [Gemmatimonadaceae bacterium]
MDARRSLLIWGLLIAPAVPLPAQSVIPLIPAGYRVHGVVLDEKRAPIAQVEVRLLQNGELEQVTRTDAAGMFAFGWSRAGAATLSLKRLGYSPSAIQLDVTNASVTENIEATMKEVVRALPNVVVVEEKRRLHEFEERRHRHASGQFITGEEIMKAHPQFSSDVFRRVGGASLRRGRFGNAIRLRGCRPKLWIDGIPLRDVELDEVVDPSQIAGLEVYASTAGIPPEYMDREPRPCGVILVWTRIE